MNWKKTAEAKLPVIFVNVAAPGVAVVVIPLVTGSLIPATLPTPSTPGGFAVPSRVWSLLSPARPSCSWA